MLRFTPAAGVLFIALADGFKNFVKDIRRETVSAMEDAVEILAHKVQEGTPYGVGQGPGGEHMRDLVLTDVTVGGVLNIVGRVFPHPDDEARAESLEFGSEPHPPPIERIESWAWRKVSADVDPWSIWFAIKQRGTPPHDTMYAFVEGRADELLSGLDHDLEVTLDRGVEYQTEQSIRAVG